MASGARKLDKSVHSEGQSAFSELIIRARKSAHLTQHELAKRLHKPQSFVAKYEGGGSHEASAPIGTRKMAEAVNRRGAGSGPRVITPVRRKSQWRGQAA
jgi:ribosome-binding protein aMBF1 (putative translation factor)